MSEPLIQLTEAGIYCPRGGFHIDPWRPVDHAVITHGHSDHARFGSAEYVAAAPGEEILRLRLGRDIALTSLAYGEQIRLGDTIVSLHPAGHLLGSAQVRVECDGEVWVASGDYKLEPDPTCTPFEPVPCDVFISECTFGLPVYRWRPQRDVFDEINDWWRTNQENDRTSVLYAYALGKAQRVLAGIDASIGPILVHGAVDRLLDPYRREGVTLPEVQHAAAETAKATRGRALVVAPPSAAGSPWLRKFGAISDGFVSGWMQIRGTRRRRSMDRGFALSDHADWPGLHRAIEATGARRIILTHGYTDALARWLAGQGYETSVFATRFEGEADAPDETIEPANGEAD